MQNFLKKFGAIFVALLATVCLAVFAVACGNDDEDPDNGGNPPIDDENPNGDEYATDTFTVTVLYEDGTPIDGTKHSSGESWIMDALWPTMSMPASYAQVQFCSVLADGTLGTCANPVNIGEDGKATLNVADIVSVAETVNTTTVELHILNVKGYGYDKGEGNELYGKFEITEIPTEITVTLQPAA